MGSHEFGWDPGGSALHNTWEDPRIANMIDAVYQEMIRMTREAGYLTRTNKGEQLMFENYVH